MWPDRVSNPGPLTYESGALPTALRGPANVRNKKLEIQSTTALVLDAGTDNVYLICVFIIFISCLLRKVKY